VVSEEWHHIAAVIDGSNATLYLDGVVEGKMKLEKKVTLSAPTESGICHQTECIVDTKMSVSEKDIAVGAYYEVRMLPNQQGIPVPDYRSFDYFSGLVSPPEVFSAALTDRQISKLYTDDKNTYKKDDILNSGSITQKSPALSEDDCLDLAVERGLQNKLTGTTTLVCEFPFDVVIPLNSDVLWVETLPVNTGPYHSISSVDDLFRTGFTSSASMSFYEPDFTYGAYEYFDELNQSLTGKIVIAKPLEQRERIPTTLPDSEYEKLIPIEISMNSLSHTCETECIPDCAVDNSCYEPFAVSVDVRKEVTWKNLDGFSHSVTSGTPEDGPDGVFDSGLISPIRFFSHTFHNPGIYDYYCVYHPWMKGIVVVGEI
jgi:plastocyanin